MKKEEALRLAAKAKAEEDDRAKKEYLAKVQEEKQKASPKSDVDTPAERLEEHFQEGNKKITQVTVTKNGKSTVYRKVAYSFGAVYYFQDNISITQKVYESAAE